MTERHAQDQQPARLKRRADFLRVARVGSKWVTKGLVLQAAHQPKNREEAGPRLGFTVSRKVGNAVARNRARRRLKEAARQVMPGHARQAIDYVLIGRHTTLQRSWPKLVQDLETALKRIRLEE